MSVLITVVVTILIFLIIIAIHEFGHFAAAKLLGMRVVEYAIGMGPAIFKKQKGETLYSVRAFPIGGYCSLDGEDKESNDERAFNKQAKWKRFIVLVSGALLNILLGFLVYIIVVCGAGEINTPVINEFANDTYIADSGLLPGDRIVKVNNTRINIYQDMNFVLSTIDENPIDVTVKRNGEKLTFKVKPSKRVETVNYYEDRAETLTSTNGIDQPVVVSEYKDGKTHPELDGQSETLERYIIGFSYTTKKVNLFSAVREAFYSSVYIVKLVLISLWGILTGKVSVNQLSGPVGIGGAVGNAIKFGWMSVLELVALITLNLGVFNLLPIPALDGGRIVFLAIEAVRRKQFPVEKEAMVNFVFLALLLVLAAYVMINDIFKLI